MLTGVKFKSLNQLLAGELAEVEIRFAAELHSEISCVNDLARHIEQYRGKMLRPALLLLTGTAIASDGELMDAHRTLATVVEMVHMATLVHDDILDDADTRRSGATVNALRGNEAAVMLGDYLISHAYHLCSSLDNQTASRLIAHATNIVCEGELLQLTNRYNWSLDEQTYFAIIERKTGALCGVACQLGALASQADKQLCLAMRRFGQLLGSAFQIIDDVLDLVGDPSIVGKSLGKDLEKGKLTLPLIHHLETTPATQRQSLVELLRTDDPHRTAKVVRELHASDSVNYARRRAEQLVAAAKRECANLPASPACDALNYMADAVLTRQA